MAWNTDMPSSVTIGTLVSPTNYLNPVVDNINYLLNPNSDAYTDTTRSATTYQTTSTSWADIDATNLSKTLETHGGPVWVIVEGKLSSNNVSGIAYLDIKVDGTTIGDSTYGVTSRATTENYVYLTRRITGITAGSHTIKLQYKTNNASYTATLAPGNAGGTTDIYFSVSEG